MDVQQTIKRQVSCAGIGLHSGQKVTLTLKPAAADTGIRFRRTDLGIEIPASVDYVSAVQYATVLGRDGATVETVEHLLAALVATGIDNVVVELSQREVPIMDGSSAPFLFLLQEAGVKRSAGRGTSRSCGRCSWRAATSGSRSTRRTTSRSATRSASIIRCYGTRRGPSASRS